MPALELPEEEDTEVQSMEGHDTGIGDAEDTLRDMPALETPSPERPRQNPMVRFTTVEEETGDLYYFMPSVAEVFDFGPEHFGFPIPYHVHVAEVHASVLTSLLLLKVGEIHGLLWAECKTVWDRLWALIFTTLCPSTKLKSTLYCLPLQGCSLGVSEVNLALNAFCKRYTLLLCSHSSI
ncbi:hypothetical protein M758_UG294700 [Ceratodon purpureus]|nr:hypothetical protein M758_UG294700 [Ceratodon purpureus]